MISMSVRFPRRSRTCRPVVPASPSMKTFLVANNSITRGLDDAAEGANAETPGATAATAPKKARDDGDSFIALKCPSSVEWRNWKVWWNRGMQPAKQIINCADLRSSRQAGRQSERSVSRRQADREAIRHTQITDRKTQNDRSIDGGLFAGFAGCGALRHLADPPLIEGTKITKTSCSVAAAFILSRRRRGVPLASCGTY